MFPKITCLFIFFGSIQLIFKIQIRSALSEFVFADVKWIRICPHSPQRSDLHTHNPPKTPTSRANRIEPYYSPTTGLIRFFWKSFASRDKAPLLAARPTVHVSHLFESYGMYGICYLRLFDYVSMS